MANLNSFFIYSLPIFLLLIFCAQFCHSFSISSILFGSDEEDTNDPDRPLMCYRGIKYFIGQEEIDDNIKCEGNLLEKTAGMNKYCYKFTSNSAGTKFVKRGCSVMICTPLGKGCTKMAFEGVQGEMCCCSDTSYCNGTKLHRMNGGLGIMALILAFSIIAFILI